MVPVQQTLQDLYETSGISVLRTVAECAHFFNPGAYILTNAAHTQFTIHQLGNVTRENFANRLSTCSHSGWIPRITATDPHGNFIISITDSMFEIDSILQIDSMLEARDLWRNLGETQARTPKRPNPSNEEKPGRRRRTE